MAQAGGTMAEAIRVFVSYSRADSAFADELVLGLTACGFSAYIDREDIAAGEDWAQRLTGLISEADTVVHILTPDALTSEACAWERAESHRLAKRLLPVVWRPTPEDTTPPELKRLNYIFFWGDGHTFASGLATLAEALRTDIDWIREHTRLAALAMRWSARNQSEALLLRGDELDAARTWESTRTASAPAILDIQADYIRASHTARVEAERKARRVRTRLLVAVSLVAVAMTGLAGAAFLQSLRAASSEKNAIASLSETVRAQQAAERANLGLREANIRLDANVGLQAAPRDGYLQLAPGWFRIAARYSGAVAYVARGDGATRAELSGFLLDGALVHPRYAGEALLLTPVASFAGASPSSTGVTAPDGPQAMLTPDGAAPRSIAVRFPAIAPDDAPLTASERLWRTPVEMGGVTPFELWRLSSPPPAGARGLIQADIDCAALGMGGGDDPGPRVPLAMYGATVAGNDRDGMITSLFLSERLDRSDPYAILYTHTTAPGAMGGVVFDLSSGKAAAIHVGRRSPGADGGGADGQRIGYGISLRLVLDMVRGKMSDADAQLGPICG